MVQACKGICDSFSNIQKSNGGIGGVNAYTNGQKRCKRCGYYKVTTDLRCGCCGGLFKTRSMRKKINPLRINDNRPLYKYNYQELANYIWRIV